MADTLHANGFSISVLGRLTGYSTDHIRDLCRQGVLTPPREERGRRRFNIEHADALLERRLRSVR
jgi:DNA-binding transcriptional MerR regulator